MKYIVGGDAPTRYVHIQPDRQTDRQSDSNKPPNFVCWYKTVSSFLPTVTCHRQDRKINVHIFNKRNSIVIIEPYLVVCPH